MESSNPTIKVRFATRLTYTASGLDQLGAGQFGLFGHHIVEILDRRGSQLVLDAPPSARQFISPSPGYSYRLRAVGSREELAAHLQSSVIYGAPYDVQNTVLNNSPATSNPSAISARS